MEISRHQFTQKLHLVEKAIKECDVIAIDTELSGLHRPPNPVRLYSMKDRYTEYREASERFLIIQFGLCAFTFDKAAGRYIAKPFNFYIFPTSVTGQVSPNRVFFTQAQAFDFLVKQSFDFNKWVYQGIPYMTKAEENTYIEEATKKLNNEMPDIPIDDKEVEFVEAAKAKIDSWLQSESEEDGVNITTKNGYQRRLVYQEIRKYEGLTAVGMQGFIRAQKFNEKQQQDRTKEKKKRFKKDVENTIGFRRVIDMISESGKIVVGHNMLLDICHIMGQFVEPLPPTLAEFKTLAHRVFPKMIDTKHIVSTEPELRELFGSATHLEALRFETNKQDFSNPRIDMHPEFLRYLTEMAHEAGYDAFMTGAVFLKLISFLDKRRNPHKFPDAVEQVEEKPEKERKVDADGWDISDEEEEPEQSEWDMDEVEEVYHYGSTQVNLKNLDGSMNNVLSNIMNKAAIVRTAYEYFDFTATENIYVQSNAVQITYPEGTKFNKQVALELFDTKYGKFIVEPHNNTSAFVIFENLKETIPEKVNGFIILPVE